MVERIARIAQVEDPAPWRSAVLGLLLCSVALATLYFQTLAAAVTVWTSSEAHQFSFLVIPVSLYFIWLRRADMARLSPQPMAAWGLLALPLGLLWLVADAAQVAMPAQIAVVGLFQVAVLTLLGLRCYRALLFPLLFLWLLVPFGEFFLPFLIAATTTASVTALNLLGLTALADGSVFSAGANEYTIIAACAALDFLLGNLVIALVFANLMYRGIGRRIMYVLATSFAAFFANVVRIVTVILITEGSGGAIDLAIDHALYGWLVFFVTVILEMKIGMRFRDSGTMAGRVVDTNTVSAAPALRRHGRALAGALALAMGIAVPPLYAALLDHEVAPVGTVSMQLPASLQPDPRRSGEAPWLPHYAGSDLQIRGQVLRSDPRVEVFMAYYWDQARGSEMIQWGNDVYDAEHWLYLERQSRTLATHNAHFALIETRLHDNDDGRRLVWHWYWIDGRFVADPVVAKLLQAKAYLLRDDRRAALVAVSTLQTIDRASAEVALRAALSNVADIERLLVQATAERTP